MRVRLGGFIVWLRPGNHGPFLPVAAVEIFILLLIVANVLMMCMSIENQLFDIVICIFFTAEMTIRIVACGFWEREGAYFRDPWNRLDAFLTTAGYLQFVMNIKLSVLRVVRLLRLQKFEMFAGIRDIISAIANSIPSLMDVVALLLFAFTIYGIVGVTLYMGDMQNRCYVAITSFDPATNITTRVPNEDLMSNPELFCAVDPAKTAAKPCPDNMICAYAGDILDTDLNPDPN